MIDLQRKLIKTMEDIQINYGNYVQNSAGQIIQFLYGGDIMDACYLEHNSVYISTLSTPEFEEQYITTGFTQEDECLRSLREKMHSSGFPESLLVPFSMKRILDQFTKGTSSTSVKIDANTTFTTINSFLQELKVNNMLENLHDYYIINCKNVLWSWLSSKQLRTRGINITQLKKILTIIKERYTRAIIQPGEMIGAIAAQSIGESLTQLCLNTFHSAGIASQTKITAGVPRFKELIHVTKSPSNPTIDIVIKNEYTDRTTIERNMEQLLHTTFEFFINEAEIYYDPDYTKTNNLEIYKEHQEFFGELSGEASPWVLVIKLLPDHIFQKKIFMSDFYNALSNYLYTKNLLVEFSDDNDNNLEIHIRNSTHTENGFQMLQTTLSDISKIVICGLSNITGAYTSEIKTKSLDQNTGKIVQNIQPIITTFGGNLNDILIMPFVDPYNTVSNDICNVLEVLGMEAAREVLHREIVLLLANNGIYINNRHIDLLCDLITHKTFLLSMDRHGAKKSDSSSCLTKSSFEESVEQLAKGAIFSERDTLLGITPNIIMGQIAKFGSGSSSIVVKN